MAKSADAFRTISEVADWLGVQTHVLRFWESKFTQVKPMKRAGGRRYYRPSDMALLGGIKRLLHDDGMTIKGVQKVLRERGIREVADMCTLPLDIDDTGEDATSAPQALSALPKTKPSETPAPSPAPGPADGQDSQSIAETAPLPQVQPTISAPELDFGQPPQETAPAVEAETSAEPEEEAQAPETPADDPGQPSTRLTVDAAPKPAPQPSDPPVGLPSFMRQPSAQDAAEPATPSLSVTSPVTPPQPVEPAAEPAPAPTAEDVPDKDAATPVYGKADLAQLRALYDRALALSARWDA